MSHEILQGRTSEALLEFARTKKASVLVVSADGQGASPLYRVGGTAERLEQITDLPLLVARDAAPFDAWRSGRALRTLLAVDWTESSSAAIEYVRALRGLRPCDVTVGYVYYSGAQGEGAQRYGLPVRHSLVERDPEAEALLGRDLRARVGELGGEGAFDVRPKHGVGRIGDHLVELAESERADLIVMGTHHARGLARYGASASVVLHHARASVVIVPRSEHAVGVHAEVPRLRRVLVPTDLSALASAAVPFGYALVGERGEVVLLHVAPEGTADHDTELRAELRASIPTRGLPEGVVTRIELVHHADPAKAVCDAAERWGADAVCLGSHGRSGLARALVGSVAESVLRQSRRPVFIVRPLPP